MDSYGKFYNIKVAAYSRSVQNLNCNWNLDCLLDFSGKSKGITFKNSNFALYVREIKKFAPQVIISDVEIYTSYVGLELGVPVWQVSPLLLYYGLEDKGSIYKYYSGLLSKDIDRNKYISYILGNADKRLILSHLGDINNRPTALEGYQWIRPNYHIIDNDQKIINVQSTAISLADAYFSGKQTSLQIDYGDPESIITSQQNYKHGLSISSEKEYHPFDITVNSDVKFLSQHLKDLDI